MLDYWDWQSHCVRVQTPGSLQRWLHPRPHLCRSASGVCVCARLCGASVSIAQGSVCTPSPHTQPFTAQWTNTNGITVSLSATLAQGVGSGVVHGTVPASDGTAGETIGLFSSVVAPTFPQGLISRKLGTFRRGRYWELCSQYQLGREKSNEADSDVPRWFCWVRLTH